MSLGLQLTQNLYDELEAIGLESIVDRHIIAFDERHKLPRFSKELNDASIQASSFLPMLAKANNLIAFHIHKFPQQKMGQLLDKILESKLDNEWTWENRKYDLLATERYLEAIGDFYDYYDKYERRYAEKSTKMDELRKQVTEEIVPELEKRAERKVTQKLEAKHKEQLEAERANVAVNYPIETQLNKRIDGTIESRTVSLLCETLDAVSKFNRLPESEKGKMPLTDQQERLLNSLNGYIASHFARSLEVVSTNSDVDSTKLSKASKDDLNATIGGFFEFIAKHNLDRQGSSKLSLKNIFEILKGKE
jgi:hypothetical protein